VVDEASDVRLEPFRGRRRAGIALTDLHDIEALGL
jgi:hypothetical protein